MNKNLFAVTNFIRNSAQPKENSLHNIWISRGFGKIGVIQHGSYIPSKIEEIMADMEITAFTAVVRIVQELNPGQNTGTLLLHLISLVGKAGFTFLNESAFNATVEDGSVILRLNSDSLENCLLWTVNPDVRTKILSDFKANLVIPNVAPYVKSKAASDSDVAVALDKSNLFVSYTT